jgi:hypothetical protein
MVAAVTGCASTPISQQESNTKNFRVPENHAYIYLYRRYKGIPLTKGIRSTLSTVTLAHTNVWIDDGPTISISDGEYYVVEVSPGDHIIKHSIVMAGIEADIKSTPTLSLSAGQWTWVNFSEILDPSYHLLTETQAKSDILNLKFIQLIDQSDPQTDLKLKMEAEAEQKAAEQRVAAERVLIERKVAERKAADARKSVSKRRIAAERKAAEERKKAATKRKLAAERKAAEKKKAAEEKGEYLPSEGLL